MLLVVFTSVPFLFMSGVSWPKSNIPEIWQLTSYLFPSTFGIQGFIKLNTMGCLFSDIWPEIKALWMQVIVYGALATLVTRWQVRRGLIYCHKLLFYLYLYHGIGFFSLILHI